MAKFHVNPITGNAGKCTATKDNCPFGSDSEHYASADDARQAFERGQSSFNEQAPLKSLTFNGNTWKKVTLEGARYGSNDAIAILSYVDGEYGPEPLADVSVNLEELGLTPRPGAFFVKNWSETSGLAEALENAGVITRTGRVETVNQWGSEAVEAELTPKYQYLAIASNWERVTDQTPEPKSEEKVLAPSAESALDITASAAASGFDYSVSFQNRRGREATAEVLSNGNVFAIESDGKFEQTRDPRAGRDRNPKTPTPEMLDTLNEITKSLMSKKGRFGVGFSGTPWGTAAESASIISDEYYFTINPDGSFKQTDR